MSEAVYARANAVFNEQELTALTLAVVEINGWNRLLISFNVEPEAIGRRRTSDHGHQ